jgi:hypothetical protein
MEVEILPPCRQWIAAAMQPAAWMCTEPEPPQPPLLLQRETGSLPPFKPPWPAGEERRHRTIPQRQRRRCHLFRRTSPASPSLDHHLDGSEKEEADERPEPWQSSRTLGLQLHRPQDAEHGMMKSFAPSPPWPAGRRITSPPVHLTEILQQSTLFTEIVALLPLLGSDHRSWRRSSRSLTWRRIQSKRSAAPLLTTGITPSHGSRPGNLSLTLPMLQPAPRLSLFRAASPPARTSVRPGEEESTLKEAERRTRERTGKD